jgi:protein gp37
VFVCDTGDLFHERVPQWFIFEALNVMHQRRDITWQILTKRVERMYEMVTAWMAAVQLMKVPRYMWLGVSVENQTCAAERRRLMAALPAAIRWVSYEPALGPVDWKGWEFLDWLVAGGESGSQARAAHPWWFRNSRDWALQEGVAFFFKQWGEYKPADNPTQWLEYQARSEGVCDYDTRGIALWRIGRKAAGNVLDWRTWHEFPI